jgi:hypothetical protein
MRTYTILINEEQRQIINSALQALSTNAHCIFSKQEGTGLEAGDSQYEEFEYLRDMFKGLPEVEGPEDMIHGLCL